jgi:GNAT superfamily N-acetyltransferase
MMTIKAEEAVYELESKILEMEGVKTIHMCLNNQGHIQLSLMVIHPEYRKRGVGSKVVDMICEYADEHCMKIVLTPADRKDKFGTTSKARLIKFYRRFGFYLNKGRNKDFTISDAMIRRPLSDIAGVKAL